jgi:ornithine cyclodeaminase/alanine dehydrogenase-like protein (mu-crystallin family)
MLGREDLLEVLDLPDVIASQEAAFLALAGGTAQLGPRVLLPEGSDVAFSYAARLSSETGPVCKFGSVNPGNAARGLPSVSALVVLLDPVTGRPRALLDGEAITTLRTPAASVVAVRALAREGAARVAVLGCGVQGRAHARALAAEPGITEVTMWSPYPAERAAAVAELDPLAGVAVRAATTVGAALADADIIVTATTSREPVLSAAQLLAGATVISVGSFAPDRREVGDDLVGTARVIVDDVTTAVTQAGSIVHALATGALHVDQMSSLGDVLSGGIGRRDEHELVLYTSVGLGLQDAAAGWLAVSRADAAGRGRAVAW